MNREQAEKWLKDRDKKPYQGTIGGYWWTSTDPYLYASLLPLPDYFFTKKVWRFETEEAAMEWAIEQLMKLPDEPEVDVRELAKEWIKKNMNLNVIWVSAEEASEALFIAGYEAAKRGER